MKVLRSFRLCVISVILFLVRRFGFGGTVVLVDSVSGLGRRACTSRWMDGRKDESVDRPTVPPQNDHDDNDDEKRRRAPTSDSLETTPASLSTSATVSACT